MYLQIALSVCVLITPIVGHDVKGFDDSVLFSLNWPGDTLDTANLDGHGESIIVTSSHQEKYQCFLPNVQEKEVSTQEKYDGPTALEVLTPLFYPKLPCSYRLDTYWTYEVCHGRYIRQYHEDREGKTFKLQEFSLGQWDKISQEKLLAEVKATEKDVKNVPTKKIDGNNLPYFEIVMGNGTLCDLNHNRPRQTSVIYVCYVHGKNEIYSLKETSICQYEIIVLTPLLCGHQKYRPAQTGENKINCVPVEGGHSKPYNLVKMKIDSNRLWRNFETEHLSLEFLPMDINEEEDKSPQESPVDTSPLESFLSGKTCLNGGTGWWKYEFCYGKSIEQYHIDKDGKKISINLGKFDRQTHLEWISKHPHKRPKPLAERILLSHFYSGGMFCEKTGKARQTEVKLRCMEKDKPTTVSLYLLEPKYCEYILGVESPLICDILARADENGLVESDDETVQKLLLT